MPGSRFDAEDLLKKYKSGTCTDAERILVERWYEELPETQLNIIDAVIEEDLDNIWKGMERTIKPIPAKKSANFLYKAAAVFISGVLLFGGVTYFSGSENYLSKQAFHQQLKPDSNNTVLYLANGKKIMLDSLAQGQTIVGEGIKFTKTADGQITCKLQNNKGARWSATLNTITTPRGKQFEVKLPDGSRAWLNAGSSLTFPAAFGKLERQVSMTGEAYFEIAKNKKHPFKVKTREMEVKVLGTHFNVSAYTDDEDVSTTLLEGAVEVRNHNQQLRILPGEVATWNDNENKFNTNLADLEAALAWKNGYFIFNEEHIQEIMKKLSRWYNVPVVYEGNLSGLNFSAKISRKASIAEVLNILQSTGTIHFKIEERRVIVSRQI